MEITAAFPRKQEAERAIAKLKRRKLPGLSAEMAAGFFSAIHDDFRSSLQRSGVPPEDVDFLNQKLLQRCFAVVVKCLPGHAYTVAATLRDSGGELGVAGQKVLHMIREEAADSQRIAGPQPTERQAAKELKKPTAPVAAITPEGRMRRECGMKQGREPILFKPKAQPVAPATRAGTAQQPRAVQELSREQACITWRKETVTELKRIEVPVRCEEMVIRQTSAGESPDAQIRLPLWHEAVRLLKEKEAVQEVIVKDQIFTHQ